MVNPVSTIKKKNHFPTCTYGQQPHSGLSPGWKRPTGYSGSGSIRLSTAPEVDYGDSEYQHRSFALLQLLLSHVNLKSELAVSMAVAGDSQARMTRLRSLKGNESRHGTPI